MNKFLEKLNAGETLVADGATGTNLQKMGLKPGKAPEDLVIDQPDLLLKLESSFVEAGSDIILTCTFGGTRLRMKDSKYQSRAPEINTRAAELARKAASARTLRHAQGGADVLIAGSMGPTGSIMKPYGPMTPDQAFETYAEQAKALADGGVDFLLIETMFALDEADAAFNGARSVTDLPIVVSFSYDRGVRTMMGVKPKDVAKKYKDMGATLIGANCGTTLENMEAVLKEYGETIPGFGLWAKPNAGVPHMDVKTEQGVYDMTPEDMSAYTKKYVAIGARVIGGCCGSTPSHVAAIAKAAKSN